VSADACASSPACNSCVARAPNESFAHSAGVLARRSDLPGSGQAPENAALSVTGGFSQPGSGAVEQTLPSARPRGKPSLPRWPLRWAAGSWRAVCVLPGSSPPRIPSAEEWPDGHASRGVAAARGGPAPGAHRGGDGDYVKARSPARAPMGFPDPGTGHGPAPSESEIDGDQGVPAPPNASPGERTANGALGA
jgi:hypothetical protein